MRILPFPGDAENLRSQLGVVIGSELDGRENVEAMVEVGGKANIGECLVDVRKFPANTMRKIKPAYVPVSQRQQQVRSKCMHMIDGNEVARGVHRAPVQGSATFLKQLKLLLVPFCCEYFTLSES